MATWGPSPASSCSPCSRCWPSPRRTRCPTIACSRSCGVTTSRRSRPTPCRPWCRTCAGCSAATPSSARGRATCCGSTRTRSTPSGSTASSRPGAMPSGAATTPPPASSSAPPWRWCGAHRSPSWSTAGSPRDAATRLQELMLAAQEGLVDAELATGHHADVLAKLHELIVEHPLRERFRAQLIVALYRCGRQADALAAYRDARDHLLDELGLDPGPELRALERAVLAQDPALDAPIAVASSARGAVGAARRPDVVRRPRARADRCRRHARSGPAGARSSGRGASASRGSTLELAHRLASDREVRFVELAPLVDGAAVPDAVAAAVGAPERAAEAGRPAPTATQRAIERLADRDAVVILDNCEHVADAAAALVVALLQGCPNVRILTTSREPLLGRRRAPGAVGTARRRHRLDAVRRAGQRGAAADRRRRRPGPGDRPARPPPRRPAARHRARGRPHQDAPGRRDRQPARRPLPAAATDRPRRARPATTGSRRPSHGATTCCSTTSGGRSGASPCSAAGRRPTPPTGCAVPTPSSWPAGSSIDRCCGPTPAAGRCASRCSSRCAPTASSGSPTRASRTPRGPITWRGASTSRPAPDAGSAGPDQLEWLRRLDDEHDNLRCRPRPRRGPRSRVGAAPRRRPRPAVVVPRPAPGDPGVGGSRPRRGRRPAVGRRGRRCWRASAWSPSRGSAAGADRRPTCATSCCSPSAASARRWRSTRPAATSRRSPTTACSCLATLTRQASIGEQFDAVEVDALRRACAGDLRAARRRLRDRA